MIHFDFGLCMCHAEKTRVSEVLKRSSGLRGGNAYKAKKIKQTSASATSVSTPKATEKSQQDVTDRSPSSSEDDNPTQNAKNFISQRQMLDCFTYHFYLHSGTFFGF